MRPQAKTTADKPLKKKRNDSVRLHTLYSCTNMAKIFPRFKQTYSIYIYIYNTDTLHQRWPEIAFIN